MVADSKKILRNKIRELKKGLLFEEKLKQANRVFSRIEETAEFKNSNIILFYWSLPDELPTHEFVKKWSRNKTILLPVMVEDELVVKEYINEDGLSNDNDFGVFEPQGDIFTKFDAIDIIIVPGIAFDSSNQRLGRGKGFYDRLLKNTQAIKVGVGFSFQLLDTIPTEKHDVRLDRVVCC